MPLLEESSVPRDCPPTVPVVVIGNGPSGICLSYLLNGYTPYLDPATVHPNPLLYRKLQESKHLPITEQDLELLCEGLEGRSANPVAVLFDTLLHPNADMGFELPPMLQWRLEHQRHIPHLVLGKATPGGAWHAMEGSMLTISLGIWMELPGVNFRDICPTKRRGVASDRASPEEISSYYKNYVKLMGLQKNFADNTYVTSVQRLHRDEHSGNLINGQAKDGSLLNGESRNGLGNGVSCNECSESEEKMADEVNEGEEAVNGGGGGVGVSSGPKNGLWEVRGYQHVQGDTPIPFSLFTENVVLATGASDSPARLGVEGEDLPFVFHSVRDLGIAVSNHTKLGPASDPVLVVGAGLSAADAILCARNHDISVLHAFRKHCEDPQLIFKQLPKTLYPEYHHVYNMMCSHSHLATDGGSPARPPSPGPTTNGSTATGTAQPTPTTAAANGTQKPGYISLPEHCVVSFQPDMRCVLRGPNGALRAFKVSMALVLIGSHPNLFFLKDHGRYLSLDPERPVSCKQNPLEVHPYTFECCAEPGLFAMGPLVGDNFVRFLKGGALGIASCLLKRLKGKKRGQLIGNGSMGRGEDCKPEEDDGRFV